MDTEFLGSAIPNRANHVTLYERSVRDNELGLRSGKLIVDNNVVTLFTQIPPGVIESKEYATHEQAMFVINNPFMAQTIIVQAQPKIKRANKLLESRTTS